RALLRARLMQSRKHLAEVCCGYEPMRWHASSKHDSVSEDRVADTIWVNAGHMFRAETTPQALFEQRALVCWRAVWQRNDHQLQAIVPRLDVLRKTLRLGIQGIEQHEAVDARSFDATVLQDGERGLITSAVRDQIDARDIGERTRRPEHRGQRTT